MKIQGIPSINPKDFARQTLEIQVKSAKYRQKKYSYIRN